MLGNIYPGLIVSLVIPISLFFTLTMIALFGVLANLLSIGSIDFGIILDRAMIIVENVLDVLYLNYLNKENFYS